MLLVPPAFGSTETERLYLSGTGADDPVDWEFRCREGRRCGEWTTIPVPSQWEQQGFGEYNYGHDEDKHSDEGHYRQRFQVPSSWSGRRVALVFDGVMTDTEVTVNGRSAGPIHRGGFYRFRYDITPLLRIGEENLLEVRVRETSSDRSVELAERDADYWVFGGIYRPVFLEATPVEAVEHLALDARHDGSLQVLAQVRGLGSPARLWVWVEAMDGARVGQPLELEILNGVDQVRLEGRFEGIQPWSAETPHLYNLQVELQRDGRVLHATRERFGFRTVEVRPGEGVFVNGRRTLLKGVNRHAFHPASGRTLHRELDRQDVEWIKALNMNAVRASHYPPDKSFLELADEMGLYVLNELAGWHDAYGTEIGRRLVAETVRRDVNHPSVIFWNNGNEGGWNTDLDAEFALHDPQRRPVLHPDETFGGFDTQHYLTWEELETHLDPNSWRNRWRARGGPLPVVMPTELLHGLYDGGSGASLEDYGSRLRSSPRGGGAFLWSFTDESVERTDRGGELDSDGNHAPDGVLGPYRELTGNYHAVRAVFSPVWIAVEPGAVLAPGSPATSLKVENRFDHTDLSACRFAWRALHLPRAGQPLVKVAVQEGEFVGPPVPPGGTGVLNLPFLAEIAELDALELTAFDPLGRAVQTWTWLLRDLRAELVATARSGSAALTLWETAESFVMRAGEVEVEIGRSDGVLRSFRHGGASLPVVAGPSFLGVDAGPLEEVVTREEAGRLEVVARSPRGTRELRWELFPSGWLRLGFSYELAESRPFHGLGFDLSEEAIKNFLWLGRGPARQWKNRLQGGTLGVWGKDLEEPEAPGYYGDVIWSELWTPSGTVEIAFETPDLFLGVLTPTFPEDAEDARAPVPEVDLSFLPGIPAIGTKFSPARDLGPQAQPHRPGSYGGALWIRLVERPRTEEAVDSTVGSTVDDED